MLCSRICVFFVLLHRIDALSMQKRTSNVHSSSARNDNEWICPRRSFLAFSSIALPLTSSDKSLAAPPLRTVDVGGGFDLYSPPAVSAPDVAYPPSLIGLWQCQQVVTQVDGNVEQAETVWCALGGGRGSWKQVESFLTKYIESGEVVVLDRGFEMRQRKATNNNVQWDAMDQIHFAMMTMGSQS